MDTDTATVTAERPGVSRLIAFSASSPPCITAPTNLGSSAAPLWPLSPHGLIAQSQLARVLTTHTKGGRSWDSSRVQGQDRYLREYEPPPLLSTRRQEVRHPRYQVHPNLSVVSLGEEFPWSS